jgi:RNA polymerase sigma-70 factor (ECF subfamily)
MGQNLDQPYIDRVLTGDIHAYSVLVDRYKQMVFTLAIKVLKNREEAEEVAQDVFVKIYQVLGTFKGESKFSTWVYKIAYHRSLDHLRSNKRKVQTVGLDTCPEHFDSPWENGPELLEANENSGIIENALKQLSAEENVLITLHYYEGLSLKEISVITNLSANTIKVRLFRCRKRLAQLLKPRLEPERRYDYGTK